MQRSFRAVSMNGQESGGKSCLLWNCWDGRQCRVRVCRLILECIVPPSRQLRQNNNGEEIKLFQRHFDYSSIVISLCACLDESVVAIKIEKMHSKHVIELQRRCGNCVVRQLTKAHSDEKQWMSGLIQIIIAICYRLFATFDIILDEL